MSDPCVEEILKKVKDSDRKHVEEIVKLLRKEYRNAFLDGMTNPESQYRVKAKQVLDRFRRDIEINKVELIQNIHKGIVIDTFVSDPTFEVTKDNWGTMTFKWENAKVKGFEAFLLGSNDPKIKGSGASVGAIRRSIVETLSTALTNGLESSDFPVIASGSLDLQIAIEQDQLAMVKAGKPGNPGKTGDAVALRIATAAQNVHQLRIRTLNDAGAFISELEGFTGNQGHSRQKILKAGFDQWSKKILEHLDIKKTISSGFTELNINEVLQSAFDDITEGSPQLINGNSDNVAKIIGTPGNMAERLGKSRKLFFKSAEDYRAYAKDFSPYETLGQEILANINHTARSAALIQKLGTNPLATLERKLVEYGATKGEKDWMLGVVAKELDGTTHIVGKSPGARFQIVHAALTTTVRMGMSVASQFDDLSRRAANMQIAGSKDGTIVIPIIKAFTSMLENLPHSKRVEAARLTGVAASSLIGEINDRFGGMDSSVVGGASKMASRLIKITGLNWLTDANKAAQGITLSSFLDGHAKVPYADLDRAVGLTLNRYGIGPVEWDIIRSVSKDGFIGFGDVLDLPDEKVRAIMKAGGMKIGNPAKFKRLTAQKAAMVFVEETKSAMNESGDFERALMYRGTLHDSVFGVVSRLISQFKSFPINSTTQTMDRIMLAGKARNWSEGAFNMQAHIPALATLALGGTAMGILSMMARSIVNNETPKDLSDPDTWKEAFIRGGGGGLYADFLLGEFDNRYGRNALEAVAGPIGGDFADTLELLSSMKAGQYLPHINFKNIDGMTVAFPEDAESVKGRKRTAGLAFDAIISRTPNLMYTKAAMDLAFLNQLKEYMHPGQARRKRQRMKKGGQSFIVEP